MCIKRRYQSDHSYRVRVLRSYHLQPMNTIVVVVTCAQNFTSPIISAVVRFLGCTDHVFSSRLHSRNRRATQLDFLPLVFLSSPLAISRCTSLSTHYTFDSIQFILFETLFCYISAQLDTALISTLSSAHISF